MEPRWYLTCVALLSAGAASAADSPDELQATAYRPTVSNPADLPVPHHFEWEAGGYAGRDPGDARHISVPYLLKYAFTDDFGLLIGGESFVVDRSSGDTARGWGDTSVTMKFHHAVSESTGIGLEAAVALPTASHDLGTGQTDYTLNGIASTEVLQCAVDINVGDWIDKKGLLVTLLFMVALGLGLNLTPCVYPLISVTIDPGRTQVTRTPLGPSSAASTAVSVSSAAFVAA